MRGLFLTLVLALSGLPVRAEESLPLVVERYDAIWLVHERPESRSWEVTRVHFIRGGRAIAERILCDDMLWSIDRGEFVLCWNDYGNCHRAVSCRAWLEMSIDLDDLDTRGGDSAPWWGMGRRMTDMEAPR